MAETRTGSASVSAPMNPIPDSANKAPQRHPDGRTGRCRDGQDGLVEQRRGWAVRPGVLPRQHEPALREAVEVGGGNVVDARPPVVRRQLALPQRARAGVDGHGPLDGQRGEQPRCRHRDVGGLHLAANGAGREHVERGRRPRRDGPPDRTQPHRRHLFQPDDTRDERAEVVALPGVGQVQRGHGAVSAHRPRNARSSAVSRRGRWASRSNAAIRVHAMTATRSSSCGPSCIS